MSAARRSACHEDLQMLRWHPTMSIVPSFLRSSASTLSTRSTPVGLPVPSNTLGCPMGYRHKPTIWMRKKAFCFADLIGQLGDPNYMRNANALFYEFEEIGLNKTLGYETPADVIYKYPQFYWNTVAPQIQIAIRYLNVTSSGRQWIANLYGNVFRAERDLNLSGPQM